MVSITEKAMEVMKTALEAKKDDSWSFFRLEGDTPEDCQFIAGKEETQHDHVIQYKGKKLLMVEKNLAQALSNAVIDFRETDNGPELYITLYTDESE